MNSDGEEQVYTILDGKYIVLKTLGRGATSSVKLAKDINDHGRLYAIKIVKKKNINEIDLKFFFNEMQMLKAIDHVNIIKIFDGNSGILKKSNGMTKMVNYLALELASNGELFDYIYFPKKGFGEEIGQYIFLQLLEGLEATHNYGIAHRDLKTENMMLSEDWTLKIADFGYSTPLIGRKGDGNLTTCLGTMSYCAPEILMRKPYIGTFADIFSCGVILFILVTGRLPFQKAARTDYHYQFILKNDYEGFWNATTSKIENLSNEFKTLVNCMLAFDPTQRPSIAEIRSYSWMLKPLSSYHTVKAEFEMRKSLIKKIKHSETKLNMIQNKIKITQTADTYRSNFDEFEKLKFSETRVIYDYMSYQGGFTNPCANVFIIKEINPDNILESLYYYINNYQFKDGLNKLKIDKIYDKKYGMKISEFMNETSEDDFVFETFNFSITISKFGINSFVVELIKEGGDKMKFYEVYDDILSSFTLKDNK